MVEEWKGDFSAVLKLFEQQPGVREFRRSFEAGKKQARVYPQIEKMFEVCSPRLNGDPQEFFVWFLEQRFGFELGLKSIVLKETPDRDKLLVALLRLFSNWSPELYDRPEKPAKPLISNRQMKLALRNVNRTNVSSAPEITEEEMDVIESDKGKLLANKIVEKIKKKR